MSNDINVLKPARPIPIGPGSIYIHRGRQSFPNTELRQSASADNPLLLTQSASADNLLLPKLILPGTTAFGTLVTSGVGITTTASKGPVEGTVQLQEYKGRPTQVIRQLPESLQPA